MRKLTDADRNWGPFTVGPWTNSFAIQWSSGGDDEDNPNEAFNSIRFIGFGWVFQIRIPNIIPPFRIKKIAGWDEATVQRMGRNWYYDVSERRFGFSLSNMGNGYDFLQIFFGRQTHDSRTTRDWCKHLPWKQWRCVRNSIYKPDGTHFASEERGKGKIFDFFRKKEECPAVHFGFEDYDGEMIVATCIIEEREWHKGEGWFKWLKWFSKPKISRCLDLKFSAQVGPEKGSWKGGTVGHGINMLPNETPEQAFRRYCHTERHGRGGRKYAIRFIGPSKPPSAEKLCPA